MDELIIRVIGGQATPEEEARLGEWRRASTENEERFRSTARVWEATGRESVGDFGPPPSVADIVAAAQGGATVTSLDDERLRRRGGGWHLRAAVALAASIAAVALGIRVVGDSDPRPVPLATFAAEAARAMTIPLADGSLVRLAPGSRLEQWAHETERRYSLAGKAFFAVEHDPEHPFVVETEGAEVRVLGTRFEVLQREGGARAVVLEGRVAVSNPRGRVEAPAGTVAEVGGNAAPEVREAPDVFDLLDWPGGLLVFRGTPLAMVADEVSRHFGQTLDVRGEELRSLRIVATFEDEVFEEVVLALCDVSGASCTLGEAGALMEPGA